MNTFRRKQSSYVYLGQTTSLCEKCLRLVPAKILREGDTIVFRKRCPQHGVSRAVISTDASYYLSQRDFLKVSDLPQAPQTRIEKGCPHDCGLCPDHEQHSCLALIDITDECNLECPVCFAASGPGRGGFKTLAQIGKMLDTLVESEVEPDLLQISGGEPTLHPDILRIIEMAKARPIRHIMLNTNGVRIANEPEFAEALARFAPGFEIYLQFDSLRPHVLKELRGADLTGVRRRALENLEWAGLSTTLVAVIAKGLNEDEPADIIRHALRWKCVRGVTFQPVQRAGRLVNDAAGRGRVVLSDIRRAIIEGGCGFAEEDLIPLPCNPESICIGYALRDGEKIAPVTRYIPRDVIVAELPNAISFEKYPELHTRILEFFSLDTTCDSAPGRLQSMLCCLPQIRMPGNLSYADIFRVAIVEFLDAANFCLGRVKRSCIHFVTDDGRIIPIDTYNLFYRPGAGACHEEKKA